MSARRASASALPAAPADAGGADAGAGAPAGGPLRSSSMRSAASAASDDASAPVRSRSVSGAAVSALRAAAAAPSHAPQWQRRAPLQPSFFARVALGARTGVAMAACAALMIWAGAGAGAGAAFLQGNALIIFGCLVSLKPTLGASLRSACYWLSGAAAGSAAAAAVFAGWQAAGAPAAPVPAVSLVLLAAGTAAAAWLEVADFGRSGFVLLWVISLLGWFCNPVSSVPELAAKNLAAFLAGMALGLAAAALPAPLSTATAHAETRARMRLVTAAASRQLAALVLAFVQPTLSSGADDWFRRDQPAVLMADAAEAAASMRGDLARARVSLADEALEPMTLARAACARGRAPHTRWPARAAAQLRVLTLLADQLVLLAAAGRHPSLSGHMHGEAVIAQREALAELVTAVVRLLFESTATRAPSADRLVAARDSVLGGVAATVAAHTAVRRRVYAPGSLAVDPQSLLGHNTFLFLLIRVCQSAVTVAQASAHLPPAGAWPWAATPAGGASWSWLDGADLPAAAAAAAAAAPVLQPASAASDGPQPPSVAAEVVAAEAAGAAAMPVEAPATIAVKAATTPTDEPAAATAASASPMRPLALSFIASCGAAAYAVLVPRSPVSRALRALRWAAALEIAVGLGVGLQMAVLDPEGAPNLIVWAPVACVVVLSATPDSPTFPRMGHRIVGTMVGAAFAMFFGNLLVRFPGLLVAAVGLFSAVMGFVGARGDYWPFVSSLTAAILTLSDNDFSAETKASVVWAQSSLRIQGRVLQNIGGVIAVAIVYGVLLPLSARSQVRAAAASAVGAVRTALSAAYGGLTAQLWHGGIAGGGAAAAATAAAAASATQAATRKRGAAAAASLAALDALLPLALGEPDLWRYSFSTAAPLLAALSTHARGIELASNLLCALMVTSAQRAADAEAAEVEGGEEAAGGGGRTITVAALRALPAGELRAVAVAGALAAAARAARAGREADIGASLAVGSAQNVEALAVATDGVLALVARMLTIQARWPVWDFGASTSAAAAAQMQAAADADAALPAAVRAMQVAAAEYEASSNAVLFVYGDYYRQHGGCAVAGESGGGTPLRILATADAMAASAKSFALGIAVTEVAALAGAARRLMRVRQDGGAHLYA